MKIDTATLHIIGSAIVSGSNLTLTGQLDRAAYQKVAKVIELAGGKWNRSAKCHVFADDAEERIQQMLMTGEVIDAKQEFGFFETPLKLASYVVDKADLMPHHVALEPSAGKGGLAVLMRPLVSELDCVEIQETNVCALRSELDSFANSEVYCADFLTDWKPQHEPKRYDRIVMNPPFSRQADIKHIMHAFQFLKPGGRLVSIMSSGVLFREDKLTQSFRQLIDDNDGAIEQLPEGSFRVSGTNVNTVMVMVNKLVTQ